MTAIIARLQIDAIEELIERRRVARLVVAASAAFTALIVTVAGTLAAVA